ncbi:hypothetical protein AX16_003749 [Volvariella volvacea WC 439]|nr:hypothetical protein AX16_003749 [Volvariella volvacea WC 439]
MARQELLVRASPANKLLKVILTDESLILQDQGRSVKETTIPHHYVLAAQFDKNTRRFWCSYVHKKNSSGPYTLKSLEATVDEAESGNAETWVHATMNALYEDKGIKRGRRLKVIINPFGGVGKAVSVYANIVEPILKAAGCELDVTHTTHSGHAFELGRNLTLDFDAVITVAGDGVVHEVLNGFATHEDPIRAFSIPISPVPAGSGNGLSLNLLGIKDGFDCAVAAVNAVKGCHMKVDMFSITQNGKRTFSFMSQAVGLMADLDIGTEHLRWMGDARFLVGLAKGMITFKPCPVQLSYKAAETDKERMAELHSVGKQRVQESVLEDSDSRYTSLPATRHGITDEEGWTTLNEPLLFVYAGKGPYVGRDLMAFPVSLPDDGLVDIAIMPLSTRRALISAMDGAAEGKLYWNPKVQYVKAHAYRIKPVSTKGTLSIDGESFPFQEFQVETHKALATLLSPYGYYAADVPPSSKNRAASDNAKPKRRGTWRFSSNH